MASSSTSSADPVSGPAAPASPGASGATPGSASSLSNASAGVPAPVVRVRAAAVQMTSTEDVARNLDTASRLVRRAAGDGATLVGLPENFAFLGADRDHRLAIAESLEGNELRGAASEQASEGVVDGPGDRRAEQVPPGEEVAGVPGRGPILSAMVALARETAVHLLLGGFPERGQDGTRIRNSSVLLGPEGRVQAIYRKIHLFDVDLPGGVRFRESEAIEPGKEVVVAAMPWGGLGLSVCYDLRFPELYRRQAASGARVLAVPSAFTAETGKDHWHLLLRARAVENQAYVVAPAQFGLHGGQRRSYGHALIVDPWGAVLADCGDHEGVALADLDFAYQDQVRGRLPCLDHRRL